MHEYHLKHLGRDSVLAPDVDQKARSAHARLRGAGHATTADLSLYLGMSLRTVPEVLDEHGIRTNRAGRTMWADIWEKLWHIPEVPAERHELMRKPLLTVEQVAERAGMSPRSILRDGDRGRSRYGLPRHVQLSPRRRRYHPEMILLWEMEMPLEDWMRPVTRRARMGLKPRIAPVRPP